MHRASAIELQPPAASAALCGTWQLPARRAVSLRPPRAGRLRITEGRAWATVDGPHDWREGDFVLEPGQALPVRAGQRVVLEPWTRQPGAPVSFRWEPEP